MRTDEEAIQAAITAWNESGPDAFLEFMAPDVEWHAPPGFLEGDVFHGREALVPVMREQFGSVFTDSRMELREAMRCPKGWLIAGHQTARHASGPEVEWQAWYVVDLEGGLVKRMWVFMDREPAERQAGLHE